ncbi:3-keto-disaccharide hydrolase [Mucilaginibacter sp. UYCu711]|uniref:3-keto-disaccharide hydrolase n=1 Tax=Mucilaginibacter sp. UYCu711 TaxID=3156339 RepID=UPI003D1DBEA9
MQHKYMLKCIPLQAFLLAACMPFFALAQRGGGQLNQQIALNDLSAFKSPSANWSVASSVSADFVKHNTITKKDGTGILVSIPGKEKNEDIFTTMEHGDIDLSVDFMMPKESNSGIYLQGRYEIQLLDSWGKSALTSGDLGSIYERWDDARPAGQQGYDGVAPRINVSRAPGLWQNIRIAFQAPKFDASGKKIANARIVRIILNGVTIIENAELQAPTRGSAFANEAATGPLRIQGDHGAVALKNIRYSTRVNSMQVDGTRNVWDANEKPVNIEVKGEPVVFRSFMDIPGKRITHSASVGLLHNISFGYDLSNGAVYQIWKGAFLDASPMWLSRGDGNSRAIGSVIPLDDKPALAYIHEEAQAWPDSLATGVFRAKGYELDADGIPTFKYNYDGILINDKATSEDGKNLDRKIWVDGPAPKDLYARVADARDITDLGNGMYAINNFTYYVQLDKSVKPLIRTSAKGKELLLPLKNTDKGTFVQYSLIW